VRAGGDEATSSTSGQLHTYTAVLIRGFGKKTQFIFSHFASAKNPITVLGPGCCNNARSFSFF
jgi:hypothetical protein